MVLLSQIRLAFLLSLITHFTVGLLLSIDFHSHLPLSKTERRSDFPIVHLSQTLKKTLKNVALDTPRVSLPQRTESHSISPTREAPQNPFSSAPSDSTEEISSQIDTAPCLSHIQSQIKSSLEYPLSLRRRRIQGAVIVQFKLNSTGHLEAIEVSQSSGNSDLDRLAVDAVIRSSPFQCSNFEQKKIGSHNLSLPIQFKLN